MTQHKKFWWIRATDEQDGKDYLVFGSALSEQDARIHGLELLGNNNFQIKELPTRDLQRASALWRGKKLEQTHSLSKSTQRIGHDASLKRDLRKKRLMQKRPAWL